MNAASVAALQSQGVSYDTWTWDQALKEGAVSWPRLLEETGANFSLHPGWVDAVVRSHGVVDQTRVLRASANGASAFVPVLSRADRLHGVPVRCIDLASNLVSYHAQLLYSGAPELALDALFDYAQRAAGDVVRIANLAEGSASEAALQRLAAERGFRLITLPGDASPFLPITMGWDAFLAERAWKFRSNLQRAVKQMAKAGETAMRWFEAGADTKQLLADMLVVEAASWKAQSGIAISQRPIERDYYSRLLPFLASNRALFANMVYVADKPVGYVLCARWKGWVGQLKTSFDESIRHAGTRVVDESIRHAFETGCSEYDFLGNAAPHKLRWTDKIRKHTDYFVLLPTLRSRLVRVAGALLKYRRKPAAAAPASEPAPAAAEE